MTVAKQDAFPNLPITCLTTAESKTSVEAFSGKSTVIDFWTTKCTRCPQALDDLNSLAEMPEYENVRFTSIVLSTAEEEGCDSARNILEAPDDSPRWNSISHYHMDLENKEVAKKELGFTQVPFYVVLNEKGDIVQKGSKAQVNFKEIAGLHELEEESKVADNEETGFPPQERIFCLDDDF